ncbi:MAG: hemerythrin domain-containing protein [Arenimonas sp.]
MNAIQLLKDDHKKVRKLLSELEATTVRGLKTRRLLLEKIGTELRVHSKIEEEIFYPAFKAAGEKAGDDKMYFEALEEHRAAGELVLPDLERTDPASEQFSGRAKVLKELVEHHAGEEEKEMFVRARKLLGAAELAELGARMQRRKAELLSGAGLLEQAAVKVIDALTLGEAEYRDAPPPRQRHARGRAQMAKP